jgi:hypothetical protein
MEQRGKPWLLCDFLLCGFVILLTSSTGNEPDYKIGCQAELVEAGFFAPKSNFDIPIAIGTG